MNSDDEQLEARLIAWQKKIGIACYEIGQFAIGIGIHSFRIRNASTSEHLEKELNSLDSFAHRLWNYKEWLSNYYTTDAIEMNEKEPYEFLPRISAQELITAIKDEWPVDSNLTVREPFQSLNIKADKHQLARAIAKVISLLVMKSENKDAWLIVETYEKHMDIRIGLNQGIFGAEFFATKEKAITIASLFDVETSVVRILANAYKWINLHKGELTFISYKKKKECISIALPIST